MLSIKARSLLKYIVDRINRGSIRSNKLQTLLTYGKIHEDLGLEMLGQTFGQSLLHQGLDELARFLKAGDHPAISSLIVNREDRLPGGDFFRFHGKDPEDLRWWKDEVERSLSYNWASILQVLPDLDQDPISYPDDSERLSTLAEGAVKTVTVNAYERNPDARQRCIEHYGFACSVCQSTLEDRYGQIGRAYIHVHHLTPISSIGQEYRLDPVKDLRPVCPNCHAMLHRRTPPYSVEELKSIIHASEE